MAETTDNSNKTTTTTTTTTTTAAAAAAAAATATDDGGAFYSQGANTFKVPMALHRENRERLVASLNAPDAAAAEGTLPARAFVLLQGGAEAMRYDTDGEDVFRQESFFHWAFGVLEPGWFGVIDAHSARTTLFMPRLPDAYAVWFGHIRKPDENRTALAVDDVRYVDELAAFLDEAKASLLLTLHGRNSDSGAYAQPATFDGIERFRVDNGRLHPHITECRVIKTAAELDVMRYVARVSSDAHKLLMRKVRAGMMEYQAEALFCYHCYSEGGCRHVAYTCIGASGANAAILHYGHAGERNGKRIGDGDMLLFDMGGEYYGYASDITRSWPVSGKFTDAQRDIYEIVLAAQDAVFAALKPGVSWTDMHMLAERTMLAEAVRRGLLRGSVDEMMARRVGALFMPHGLGHFMGKDTHDCGGYAPGAPERSTAPGLKSLRTARTLHENMVLTVEPGFYFIPSELDKAKDDPELSQFFVWDKIDRFRSFGGVRLEDDIVITADGMENMTYCPRTVDEVEAWMRGEDYEKPKEK